MTLRITTFCRRMGAEIDINDLQTEQVEVFLAGTGSLSGYWRRKYDLLRGLYRYAISRDLVADAPLPKTVPRLPQRFLPYIYTEGELRRLFSAATSCRKDPRKLEPQTLRAILVLLYGAGLRISEAVALTVADRLTSWYQQGADVQKLLPQLATYLGHVNSAATQVYLTMTPELLHEASVRFEKYAFQEVCHE